MRNGRWWLAGSVIVLIAGLGSLLDVMEVDAAQYAEIARELAADGHWLQIHWRGADYLDKPPLLFWLSALSFKLFGVHTWSYKLPSILAAFVGVHATFRLARLFHPVEVARLAALMFASSAAFLLMTNDVRCDTLLTAAITCAIWLGAEYLQRHRWRHLVGCSVAIAAGMLAKGPLGLVAPLIALGLPVVIQRRWSQLRDRRLWAVPLIIAVCLLPMCIGLYQQYGLHGLRFYFWEQSFGRITGASPWRDTSTILFFTHEVLWMLLPWTLFALLGLFSDLRTWIRGGAAQLPELITLCGSIGVLIALSLSHYKLPHYIYPILPLLCIIAARAMRAPSRVMQLLQGIVLGALVTAALLLATWSFPEGGSLAAVPLLASVILGSIVWRASRGADRVIWPSFIVMAACGIVLNAHVYPRVLVYQANAQVGRWASVHAIPEGRFVMFSTGGHAVDFYARRIVPWLRTADEVRAQLQPGTYVYADDDRLSELRQAGLEPKRVLPFDQYPVQLIDLGFLLPERRRKLLTTTYLLQY